MIEKLWPDLLTLSKTFFYFSVSRYFFSKVKIRQLGAAGGVIPWFMGHELTEIVKSVLFREYYLGLRCEWCVFPKIRFIFNIALIYFYNDQHRHTWTKICDFQKHCLPNLSNIWLAHSCKRSKQRRRVWPRASKALEFEFCAKLSKNSPSDVSGVLLKLNPRMGMSSCEGIILRPSRLEEAFRKSLKISINPYLYNRFMTHNILSGRCWLGFFAIELDAWE